MPPEQPEEANWNKLAALHIVQRIAEACGVEPANFGPEVYRGARTAAYDLQTAIADAVQQRFHSMLRPGRN